MTHSPYRTVRTSYTNDQLLTARDLQDEAEAQTRLREIHVRALHNTWGVALGFEVVLKGNVVQVGPGLAYDCQGREILSVRPLPIALPNPLPSSRAFDLVIRHADRATLLGDRPRTTCLSDRHVTEERCLWRWSDAGAVEPGQPLPLADDVRLGEEIPIVRLQLEAGEPPTLETSFAPRHAGINATSSGQRTGAIGQHDCVWFAAGVVGLRRYLQRWLSRRGNTVRRFLFC
ncbi:MAG: hypothetical protein HC895_19710 [Leptolyngbyaceae cyanobacterium SM1_3_5]|nr:hypothetical protein [Leptolyngbyaceae cyanobacterium SM1_3_5]